MYKNLKDRQRRERNSFPQALSLRVHRALSWLKKAEMSEDNDSKFIFLWIAFNAAYAQDFTYKVEYGERGIYQEFLSKIVKLDKKEQLSEIVWSEYTSSIRLILNNEYILQSFWKHQSGSISQEEWQKERATAKAASNKALSDNDTATILSIIFSRLYTLRNQLMHGGATYDSSANRDQIRDCTVLLNSLVPVIIGIMMDGKNEIWGDAFYPLVTC
ncbi:HEPN domain-containing protein [Vibrio celticus]|uniref:Uncharacterized protein n=1 Tax=Vibrio celticus TaxID=446372 RepID=A0A1C3JJ20_9VIBR|nr:HEPN domain-containing protein [Vibrio celticus]SBT15084.1 hypothetical protein VCE7224_03867 [Vibrio celticus]